MIMQPDHRSIDRVDRGAQPGKFDDHKNGRTDAENVNDRQNDHHHDNVMNDARQTTFGGGICHTVNVFDSKLDGFVHATALGAAGTVHIRVIGINQTAFAAAENPVFWMRGTKAAAPEFGKNAHGAEGSKCQCDVQHKHMRDTHGGRWGVEPLNR
jgi:hypothetical protein